MAFCANCGHQISDLAATCPECGHPARASGATGATAALSIPNYLVWSILTTLFCCLPLGIVSIVYSSQVNTKLARGDIAGAQAASNNAKLFAWISFGVGILVLVISLVTHVGIGSRIGRVP